MNPEKAASDVLTVSIPNSLCFENHRTYNASLHLATGFPSAQAPGSGSYSPVLLLGRYWAPRV